MKEQFRTWVGNLTMIQCYAPTDAAELEDKENFYSQLHAVEDKIPKGHIKILMGDCNAKIDSDNLNYKHVMDRSSLEEMSDNETLFAEFCSNNDMMIGDRPFPIDQ